MQCLREYKLGDSVARICFNFQLPDSNNFVSSQNILIQHGISLYRYEKIATFRKTVLQNLGETPRISEAILFVYL